MDNISPERLFELFGFCIAPIVFFIVLVLWWAVARFSGRLEEPAAPPSEWIPPEPYVPSMYQMSGEPLDLPQGKKR